MKTLVKLVVVVSLVGMLWCTSVFAAPGETYTVRPDDTLWDLSKAYRGDPTKWGEVLGANPFLKEKGRIFAHTDGRTIVLLRPGEELAGLNHIGLTAEMVSFSSLWPTLAPSQIQAASAQTAPVSTVANTTTVEPSVPFYSIRIYNNPLWMWVLLVIVVILVGRSLYKDGVFSRKPASAAGPPIIPGGVRGDIPAIETRFERIAERHYGERNPQADLATERLERIGAIETGFLSGRGVVQYRDHSETRRMHREPAYRARFRFPDGTEEDLYFLQLCANDVRFYGARYAGFQWEAERVIVPMSTPQAAPPPATPTVTPLRVVRPAEPAVLNTVTVGNIAVTLPEGSSVRLEQDDRIIVSIATACEMTIGPASATETQAATA